MSLLRNQLIQAHDSKQVLLVTHVERDASGQPSHFGIADTAKAEWPQVFSVADVNVKIACGDWVCVGGDQNDEHFRKLGHLRSIDELQKKKRARFKRVMERNLGLIRPILDMGFAALDPVERQIAIDEKLKTLPRTERVSRRWIAELAIRFLLSGCNPCSVGPQNFRAGATPRRTKLEILEKSADGSIRALISSGENAPKKSDRALIALKTVERLAQDFLDDTMNQSVISVTLRRHHGLPWSQVTQHVNRELKKLAIFNDLRLTRRQVAYLVLPKVDMAKVIRRTKGHRHANTNLRKSNGDYRDVATHAGERYEFDGVKADLFVVDEFTGAVIARLQLYLVVDVFSGMVTGIYGSLGDLKKEDVPRALHLAFAPKDEIFKMLGLDFSPDEWPCDGIPEEIGADNAELRTAAAECLPELCTIGLARPYRGDDKGSVEKNADLIQVRHLIKYGPGYTEGPKKRAADDPAEKAYADIKTALREAVRYIVKTHNHRPLPVTREIPADFLKTRRPVTPFNLWTWSTSRAGGALTKYDQNVMMPRLLPSEEATITDRGIHQKSTGLYYDLPAELDHLRTLACCGGPAKHVRIFYDPLFLNAVYLADADRKKPLIKCSLAHISRDHAERTHQEMARRMEYVKKLHQLATDEFEQRDNATNESQRLAALACVKKLKEHFGSLRMRNAVAKQLDGEIVAQVQNSSLATLAAQFFTPPSDTPQGAQPPPANSTPPPALPTSSTDSPPPPPAPTQSTTNTLPSSFNK